MQTVYYMMLMLISSSIVSRTGFGATKSSQKSHHIHENNLRFPTKTNAESPQLTSAVHDAKKHETSVKAQACP